ncbi:hypothetical protein OG858_46935 (plasmid) [Streptomyces europaeiscabiei]|uniref:hypothetical protein n=1 Tax=Streptomyces europaeiscabiei TaxID=146819 RepID=UPI002E81F601|nr:hypothetical protein [Streptomyces europaeiscabiei]WUD38845.1 hypothetical protein OG858_46935 [Streptomyces europaeiscabiei]
MTTTPPAGWVNRHQLGADHGVSRPVLERLWRDRDANGHPAAVTYGGVMHWNSAAWGRWHAEHRQKAAEEAAQARPHRPVPVTGDPDELIGPSGFARILQHKDHTWVTKAAAIPPRGFPEPDSWGDPANRKRPKWKRGRAEQYARDRQDQPLIRPGRPKGSSNTQPHPYAGDPRLDLARTVLAEHPDAPRAEQIARLQQLSDRTSSASTWTKILTTARDHPTEQ